MLIHDQACATEVRRARKRGTLAAPPYRVVINERVCEGCGDCGAKSHCLSLEPVQTEFGRKTRIDQTSCNTDLSCIDGDCPAFMQVVGPKKARAAKSAPRLPVAELPEPVACVSSEDVRVRLVGIGGTGVVTVSQVLGMAALLDGHHAAGLDQTGLARRRARSSPTCASALTRSRVASTPPAATPTCCWGLTSSARRRPRTSRRPTRRGRSPSCQRASRRPLTW